MGKNAWKRPLTTVWKPFEVGIIWTALLQNPSAGTKRCEVFLNRADNAVARIHQSSLDSIHRSKLDSIKKSSLSLFFFLQRTMVDKLGKSLGQKERSAPSWNKNDFKTKSFKVYLPKHFWETPQSIKYCSWSESNYVTSIYLFIKVHFIPFIGIGSFVSMAQQQADVLISQSIPQSAWCFIAVTTRLQFCPTLPLALAPSQMK